MKRNTMTHRGRRSIFWLLLLPLSIHVAMAQEERIPTLEELIPGGDSYRYTEDLYALQWWGDRCIQPDIDTLYAIDPRTGIKEALATRAKVNEVLAEAKAGQISHFYRVQMPWAERPQLLLEMPNRYVVYDFARQCIASILPIERDAAHRDYCTASGHVAYTVEHNLYVDGRAVTQEPAGVVCGQSVHRNEFGIDKGTFWSPKGSHLAFYRMDERMVTAYPLVDIGARVGTATPIRYPMAGMTSHQVSIGIYTPATGQTIYLETGDPTDRYFTNLCWSPDEQSLYLIELNRDQNHARLCRYDARTGQLAAVVYEERHPKYVEPQHPICFLPWDETQFIYQSQRDGYNHLYLFSTRAEGSKGENYTAEGGGSYSQAGKVRRLTQGPWLVSQLLGFNSKRKEVLFTAVEGLCSAHFAVHIPSGKMNRSFSEATESSHSGILSPSGSYLIDRYATKEQPRIIDVIETRRWQSRRLLTAANPYEGYRMPSIETGTLTAADGTTKLHYRLTKPADFDPTKKYPAIVYVYGGPHAQCVTGGWQNGARGWDLYMAGRGYLMFTIDNRGSSNRGLAFEQATFRRLGIEEGKDQVKGVEFLQSLPYVDATRIGVHGWSFGGHMTTALLLRYPQLFRVGVAGGPVIDWAYYEVMYGERYMDTPQTNPEGYKACNLNHLAGQLAGHLLLIHDDQDDTCVPQHTLSFIKACVDARTYPDLFLYPGHKHNVLGRDRVHLHEKITRYFELHL